jgi:hypothetical protein
MPKRIIKKIKNAKNQIAQFGFRSCLEYHKANLIKLSIVFVALLAIYFSFCIANSYQAKKYSAILHESLIAQQSGDLKLAKEKLFQIYNSSLVPSNIKAIASIRYAGFLLDENNKIEASKIYIETSNCLFCNQYLADLSGYLAISILMSDQELLKIDNSKQIKKIHDNSKPLKWHIAEQRGFYEMQKENFKLADQIFAEIEKNQDADKAIKSRAKDARKILIQKGYQSESENKNEKKEANNPSKKSKDDDSKDQSKE